MNRLSSTRRARSRWVRAVGVMSIAIPAGAGIASAATIVVPNGDFATAPINFDSGWGCYPCGETPSAADTKIEAVAGAAQVTVGSAGIAAGIQNFSIETAGTIPLGGTTTLGQAYRATMKIKSTSALVATLTNGSSLDKPAFIRVREFDTNGTATLADDTLVSEYATDINLTAAFQTVPVESVAAGTGNRLNINIGQLDQVAGNSFTVDDVTLDTIAGPVAGAPVANFTTNPIRPRPGVPFTLTDASTGGNGFHVWDLNNNSTFGGPEDGGTGTNPILTLPAGTYVIKLQVFAPVPYKISTVAKKTIVVAPNAAPSAKVTIAPGALTAGQVVTFNDASTDSDGTIVGRTWDLNNDGVFGDFLNSPTATAIFGAGNYKVGLQVTDNEGAKSTATIDFTIAPGGGTPPGTVTPVPPGTIAKKPVVKKFRKTVVCRVARTKNGKIILKNGKPKKVCKVVWVKIVPKKK